jgi:hypothetical protein
LVVALERATGDGYIRVDKNTVRKIRAAGDYQLMYEGSGMRPEKTGFHATVSIHCNGERLAYDTFNVSRNDDRVRLANAAYRQFSHLVVAGQAANGRKAVEQVAYYPDTYMKHDLDTFCAGLEEHYNDQRRARPMYGSRERHEPEFVLKPYIMRGAGTLLFAAPGQGKSYILWLMAVCMDAGIDVLWPCAPARVLVINLERSERSVADRLGNINAVLGLQRERPIHTLNARGQTLESVRYGVDKYIEQEGIEVVLLDSMSRAGKGSLLADDVVNGYCDILNGFGVSWLALAHSPRGDDSHVFGSVMFEAAADLTVKLTSHTRLNGAMGVALHVDKFNDIGPQADWIGSLAFDPAGLTAVRRAFTGEWVQLDGDKDADENASNIDRIARYIVRTNSPVTATEIANNLGVPRGTAARLLSTHARFQYVKKQGRDALYGLAATGTDDVSGCVHPCVHPEHIAHQTTSASEHMVNTSETEEMPF